MGIVKEIQFKGVFRKADEEDNEPLDNIEATICCHSNGLVLFESTEYANTGINHKLLFDRASFYEEDSLIEVRPPYRGKYEIDGYDSDGTSINAFFINDSRYRPKFILMNLRINYEKSQENHNILQRKYGLTRLNFLEDFSININDEQADFSIKFLSKETKGKLDAELTSEMVLSNLPSDKLYNCYSSWMPFLLSFASGVKSDIIYENTTNSKDNIIIETERWFGSFPKQRNSVLSAMQSPHVKLFFQQVSPQINYNIFAEKGLGLSLFWYLQTCDTSFISTKYILLCTAIEVLIEGYKKDQINSSNRLVPKSLYRKIRAKIFEVIETFREELKPEDDREKYEVFNKKVRQSFDSGSFNQIGSLSANFESLLNQYKVYYLDLFSKLDFIKIRNDFVHRGSSNSPSTYKSYLKLQNLYIRLVLSMLNYQESYMENDGNGGLICRSLPFNSSQEAQPGQ